MTGLTRRLATAGGMIAALALGGMMALPAVAHADPVSLIRHANVLLTKNAMAKFEELLK